MVYLPDISCFWCFGIYNGEAWEIAKPAIRGIENRSPALLQKPSTLKATVPQNMAIDYS
ncbi:hypothetical protein QUB63_23180 [Microcoleus sp. ARI1-B5]|uniref:hypothetical protein n=1 Tax=unclassified Microcoleus TaxID=2642155 RepID=UPI002FCFAEAE